MTTATLGLPFFTLSELDLGPVKPFGVIVAIWMVIGALTPARSAPSSTAASRNRHIAALTRAGELARRGRS